MSQGYCDISRTRSWTCLVGHLFTRCVGITSNDCARLAVGADKIVPVTCFICYACVQLSLDLCITVLCQTLSTSS